MLQVLLMHHWVLHLVAGVEKKQLNCKIFRCGIYKKTGKQIPPHSKKTICDNLAKNNLIYGCGKPFIYKDDYVEPCDYI